MKQYPSIQAIEIDYPIIVCPMIYTDRYNGLEVDWFIIDEL